MSMISVNSSAIAAIGFENGTLAVLFHNNPKTYHLPNVPYSLFEAFVHASLDGRILESPLAGSFR